ncbi:MAG: TonB-dependent receptor plug domain-containing protein [Pseudomonadales bacterium]|nr:TonB-dependent receptor plug domain-containing protein [Pseudomonadales bacterium]
MSEEKPRPTFSRTLLFSGIVLALHSPITLAQDELEEIVVTGSYIRNSDFNGASPVDTVTQDTLLTYGAANIGQYIRDLTYTQNVDTVANVLGGAGGGQDSNSAQFNLRGLGTGSTLTLLDGRRNIVETLMKAPCRQFFQTLQLTELKSYLMVVQRFTVLTPLPALLT